MKYGIAVYRVMDFKIFRIIEFDDERCREAFCDGWRDGEHFNSYSDSVINFNLVPLQTDTDNGPFKLLDEWFTDNIQKILEERIAEYLNA